MGKCRWGRGCSAGRAAVAMAAATFLVLPGVGGAPAAAAGSELPIVFGTNPSNEPSLRGIGVVNADGSGRRVVAAPPTENDFYVQPDLSPDGRRIVFAACDHRHFRYPDQQCGLATVNVDGSDLRSLPSGEQSPRWSPDGTQIAAVSYDPGNGEAHLSVMAADGSGFRKVATTLGSDVEWSPDGKTLLYSSIKIEGTEPSPPMLYTVPVDGGAAPRLLGAGISGEDPSWSPDGTQIAFTRAAADNHRLAVSVVNADGSGLRDIVRTEDFRFGRPGWSPDSRRIAVATTISPPDGTTRTPFSTYDLVTGAVTPVLPTGGGSLSWANPAGRTPCSAGYWLVAGDGGVFSFGTAGFFGSAKPARPRHPVVAMVASPSGRGYRLVTSDAAVFSFGDAGSGATGGLFLNKPIVGMAASPSGRGYWLVASDGGVFGFGDARFFGSMGSVALNKPVVAIAASPSGQGYWLVAADGGVFSFGDAEFYGSTAALSLNKPVVSIAASPSGRGYWLVGADGGVFPFGDAARVGSAAAPGLPTTIVGASAAGAALLMAGADGSVVPFGDGRFCGSLYRRRLGSPPVGVALVPPA